MAKRNYIYLFVLLFLTSCGSDETSEETTPSSNVKKIFQLLDEKQSGIDFINEVTDQKDFNVLTYRNYYNGGGVAIGDINNDNLPDIYFTANMKTNKLYLNKGNLQFEEITEKAGVAGNKSWSTGVTMADINGDGWLDIYVCNSGDVAGNQKENELFINNGDMTFTEKAAEYGLNDNGFTTHASFFDYDRDGDLDVYILNNSFKDPTRIDFKNIRHIRNDEGGDKLLRNDGEKFVDVSEETGIFGSRIGFGLGVTVSDLNNDYYPDIYISNDFWERDYLYINNKDNTFSEVLPDRMSYTSTASMGADVADIDNNGTYDVFSTDMLPATNFRVKTNTVFNGYNLEDLRYRSDYHYQYSQNCLQINDGTGSFTEVANMANVAATDWSWAALIFDFDNDGWKDIFVSNGVYRDITNMDFSDFLEDEAAVAQVVGKTGRADFRDFVEYLPSNKLQNYAFLNQRDLTFDNHAEAIGLGEKTFSNGSAYADLDNDGDLDLVVNNVNMASSLYENLTNKNGGNNYIKVKFEGTSKNLYGIGAMVEIETENNNLYFQNYQSRGFESATEPILTVGLGKDTKIKKLKVVWNNLQQQILTDIDVNQTITLKEVDATEKAQPRQVEGSSIFTKNNLIASEEKVAHVENRFNDFDYERLLPHMISTEGPEILKGDINGDELEDFILLGAMDMPNKAFVQTSSGQFTELAQPTFETDALYECVTGTLTDLDGDGDKDLLVGIGGNDGEKNFQYYMARAYVNDGKGKFTGQLIPGIQAANNMSCIREIKWDNNGTKAIFMGGRMVPGHYGLDPRNYLFVQNGPTWKDIATQEIGQTGMVTDAVPIDIDGDGDEDLIVVGEWAPIKIYENDGQKLVLRNDIKGSNGWWQSIETGDFNNDGKMDVVVGNWGNNSKIHATDKRPIAMYVKDFDQNNKSEFIMTWYAPDDKVAYPFATKMDITSQLPGLKKSFLKNEDYAKATVRDLIGKEGVSSSILKSASNFNTVVLLNTGGFNFEMKALPKEAQFAPTYAILTDDFDGDGNQDILLGGNIYGMKPEVGKLDGSRGQVFKGDGKGGFTYMDRFQSGIFEKGEIRAIETIKTSKGNAVLIGKSNDEMVFYVN